MRRGRLLSRRGVLLAQPGEVALPDRMGQQTEVAGQGLGEHRVVVLKVRMAEGRRAAGSGAVLGPDEDPTEKP